MKKQVIALLLVLVCQPVTCLGIEPVITPVKAPPTCPEVLGACKVLVTAQDTLITRLNASQKALEATLDKNEAKPLPNWLILVGVFVGGAVAGKVLIR